MASTDMDIMIPYIENMDVKVMANSRIETEAQKKRIEFVYKKKPVYDFFKRVFDIVFSLAALVALSPIFLIIAALIKLDDNGPLFYKQMRIGKKGKPFYIYKFRTMILNADKFDYLLTPEHIEQYQKEFKIDDDPRITRVGKFLREHSLDELPQFYNSLIGTMSIVGPRPVLSEETELFEPYKNILLSVRPGISGYWQVNGRNNITYKNFDRQNLELFYIVNRSMILDFKIILNTIGILIKKTGAK